MFPSQKSRFHCGDCQLRPVLQWGRNVSIPEMRYRLQQLGYSSGLQWGRDVSIPEMTSRTAHATPPLGFNGAGMFPSQKLSRSDQSHRRDGASMGPGCFHPRNDPNGTDTTGTYYRFNGAGMFPSQKWRVPYRRRHSRSGFNGAGMFPSQKSLHLRIHVLNHPGFNGAGMFPSQKCLCWAGHSRR